MISLYVMILLSGIVLVGIGIYQKKTYYDLPHFQDASVVGYEKYQSNARGMTGLAVDAISSAAGMKYPVVDVTLDNGALKSVRLNIAVNDQVIAQRPEFDIGGQVNVQFFGSNPKIAYLKDHPMAQTVLKTSMPMLIGIALLVLAVILIGADIYYTITL